MNEKQAVSTLKFSKQGLEMQKVKLTVLVCFLVAFTTGLSSYIGGALGPGLSVIISGNDANDNDIFNVLLANFFVLFGYLIGNIVSPFITKKWSAKTSLIMALSFAGSASLVIGLIRIGNVGNTTQWLIGFGALQLVNGFGFGFVITTVNYLIISSFPTAKKVGFKTDETGKTAKEKKQSAVIFSDESEEMIKARGKKFAAGLGPSWLSRVHGTFGLGVVVVAFLSSLILVAGEASAREGGGAFAVRIPFFIVAAAILLVLIFVSITNFERKQPKKPKHVSVKQGELLESEKEFKYLQKASTRGIRDATIQKKLSKPVNLVILLAGIGLFFYLFVENSGTFYLNIGLNFSFVGSALSPILAAATGLFWTGLTGARWFFGWYFLGIKKVNRYKMLSVLVASITLIYGAIFLIIYFNNPTNRGLAFVDANAANPILIPGGGRALVPGLLAVSMVLIFLFGVSCSVVYPIILTLGTELGNGNNPVSIGFFVVMASLGEGAFNLIGSFVASTGVGLSAPYWVPLTFAPFIILLAPLFVWLSRRKNKQWTMTDFEKIRLNTSPV